MRIYLIGYMFSGKSTIGIQLAKKLNYEYLDLDDAFEKKYHTSIPIFFKRYGESAFRQLETQQLHECSHYDNIVVSTGGGTPCQQTNIDFINQTGLSIYLKISMEDICARLKKSKKPRPLLSGLTFEEKCDKITIQLAERIPFYQQAHLTLDARHPKLTELVELIQQQEKRNSSAPEESPC